MAKHHLDARRLLCPLPVIRVQDKTAALDPGDHLEVICTDPGVLQDIPAWCRINGHRVLKTHRERGIITLEIIVGRN
ncbi:MAG: sulfurtransferase TusA family protein [Gammaproteobacteria bacterium]|nr:sulfurtransferase TusA family protein [Gammaproteobacteria bacterium]